MIPISLTTALAVYSAILGVLIAIIWVYTEVVTRRAHHRLAKQFLWRCVFCGYTYLDEGAETVSECPRCGSYVSVADRHAREIRTRSHQEAIAHTAQAGPQKSSHRKRPHQRSRGPRRRR